MDSASPARIEVRRCTICWNIPVETGASLLLEPRPIYELGRNRLKQRMEGWAAQPKTLQFIRIPRNAKSQRQDARREINMRYGKVF